MAGRPEPSSEIRLVETTFGDLPGWSEADLAPALAAFRRQCASWSARPAGSPLAGGAYGGAIADWGPACGLSHLVTGGGERAFFETLFVVARVEGGGEQKLTGYFEPVIEASRTPDAVFSEPLLHVPDDLVSVDLSAFAEAYDDTALAGGRGSLTGRIAGGRVVPYPKRSDIRAEPRKAIAYARPADVYNLQVQGSGRLRFGSQNETRAAFGAQNGHRWRSALSALARAGGISSVSWEAFRHYLQRSPERASEVLNADPSYVFFREEEIPDPQVGPKGAAGVPLVAMGSIAVDPRWHPYGAIVFVDGVFASEPFRRLLVAQDTGGAIRRGPLRGDVFFGTGPEAGRLAEQMNGPARWWTLLPRSRSVRLMAAAGGGADR
jgi:membrane-bound lytic murein transglycosylase A